MSDNPDDFAEVLKYMSRNDEAMEFSEYSVQQLIKRRERVIKNSFAVTGTQTLKAKNKNFNTFEHLGYFVDKPI